VTRVGFVMRLKPGNEAIYRQKHAEIWPEMVDTLHRLGIRNYSIFLHDLTLFAYYETDDPARVAEQVNDPTVRRWWVMMEPFMEYDPDGTPWSQSIEEVFHLD